MNTRVSILIADDDPTIRNLLRVHFTKEGYSILEASQGRQALELAERGNPALIFLDVDMPEMSGLEVLEELKNREVDTPIIIFTGFSTMQTAIRAINIGAYDYLIKPLDLNRISNLTRRCLSERQLRSELTVLKETLHSALTPYELIGKSESMLEVYKAIGAISRTPKTTNVLILGESGTGKELVARQIHLWSKGADQTFIPMNVTALTDTLLESELFGYVKGAFTGALHTTPGKFELTGEGTLFLDEIGDLSMTLQSKLLRVLQEREFFPVGGKEKIKFRGRVIAATHDNLEEKIKNGAFREDLFYRLNVVTIKIPPLQERRTDIPLLVRHFVYKYSRQLNRPEPVIPEETMEYLVSYPWEGNVRELENTIIRALSMRNIQTLSIADLTQGEEQPPQFDVPILHHELQEARRLLLDAFEKKFIQCGLKESGGEVNIAAQRAGINRQSYYRLIKKYGINVSDYR